jgi:hypothetical protein
VARLRRVPEQDRPRDPDRRPGAQLSVELRALSLDEQVAALAERGLAADEAALREALELDGLPEAEPPSILAWHRETIAAADAAARVERRGEPVVLGHLEPADLETFAPIDAVALPDAPGYAVAGVDLGAASRNVRPEEALREILAAGRSPLTLDEGIALVLQQPEAIATNWGFSTAGSRRDDQRVPAFWISEGRPKLGWCWDRNPHTWLGTASCAARLAPGQAV